MHSHVSIVGRTKWKCVYHLTQTPPHDDKWKGTAKKNEWVGVYIYIYERQWKLKLCQSIYLYFYTEEKCDDDLSERVIYRMQRNDQDFCFISLVIFILFVTNVEKNEWWHRDSSLFISRQSLSIGHRWR